MKAKNRKSGRIREYTFYGIVLLNRKNGGYTTLPINSTSREVRA